MSESYEHHIRYEPTYISRESDEREHVVIRQRSASRLRPSGDPGPSSRGPRMVEFDNRDDDDAEEVFIRRASPETRRYPPNPYVETYENETYVEEPPYDRSHETYAEYPPPPPPPRIPVMVERDRSDRLPPPPPPQAVHYNGPRPVHLGPPPPPAPPAVMIERGRRKKRNNGHSFLATFAMRPPGHPTGRPPIVPPPRGSHPPPPPPLVRPVPMGFVRPAPLPPPPSPSPRVHGATHGVKPVSGHDFISLASRPHPKENPDMDGKVVLCVYRSNKRSYDYRTVKYDSAQRRIIDRELFYNMKRRYETELRGWMRRLFSFKGLTSVRLLLYGRGLYFQAKQDDPLFSLIFMRIWHKPDDRGVMEEESTRWIDWIKGEKRQHRDFDLAIELIEDYIPERIVFFVGVGLIGVIGFTSAWLIVGGDPSYVSTVMSFALTFIAAVIALTTIWDHFDGGRSKEIREQIRLVLPEHIPISSKKPSDQFGNFDQGQERHDLKGKGKEGTYQPGNDKSSRIHPPV